MSLLRRRLGWTLLGFSLFLHLVTVYVFARQPDKFAAFSVVPIWLWGGCGLVLSGLAFYFNRVSLAPIMSVVWLVTLSVGADEARALAHFGNPPPLPGKAAPYAGKPVLRVITLNCAIFSFGSPVEDLALWQPDIVLLQDVYPAQVRQIADRLYAGHGDFRAHQTNGVVTCGKIHREVQNPTQRDQQVSIRLPSGEEIEVVNVHLLTAATDLRLWQKSAWIDHRNKRLIRQQELSSTQQLLAQTTDLANTPTLFGGDFNAPATDIVHRQLAHDFVDSFASVGTGWGNTFQRRFPILRIDCIYATPHFTPLRSRVVTTRHSDHRMVVTDFKL